MEIGVTVDDGKSYNRCVTNVLMNYFNNCCTKEEVSICKFLKYITSNVIENKNSSIIYNYNLMNSLKKININNIFNIIESIQRKLVENNINDNKIYSIIKQNKVLKKLKLDNES